jgi:hypothetical protein
MYADTLAKLHALLVASASSASQQRFTLHLRQSIIQKVFSSPLDKRNILNCQKK